MYVFIDVLFACSVVLHFAAVTATTLNWLETSLTTVNKQNNEMTTINEGRV